jgi:NADPH:quinone reductase-like Zn-dependent oxidoreductase
MTTRTATPGAAAAGTMTAIVQDIYGTAPEDVLRLAETARPAIAADEVLVRVHAASVDRGTWHLMTGLPYPLRLAGPAFRAPRVPNPGRCLAGKVESVGPNVTGLKPGDEIYGTGDASFAPFARARASRIAPKPASLSFEQAAAVPVSALTALQGVRDHAKVQAGEKVLIIGASGGVGTFAVQIAKAFGAEVTGVCRAGKADTVRSIGADHVIDYTREDITSGQPRYDVILDIGGNRRLSHLRRALAPRGRLVIIGGETGGRWLGGSDRQIRALALSRLVRQRLTTFVCTENYRDLIVLTELIESGKINPIIDRTYPLAEVPQAIRYLTQGHARGKIAISVPAAAPRPAPPPGPPPAQSPAASHPGGRPAAPPPGRSPYPA